MTAGTGDARRAGRPRRAPRKNYQTKNSTHVTEWAILWFAFTIIGAIVAVLS